MVAATTSEAVPASQPTVAQMVGQLMLVRMHGQTASAAFLNRIRRGEIGGVVLFNDNFGPAGPAALITKLQQTARKAGHPPLLIAIDQEGGIVKRLPGAPSLAPPEMQTATIAKAQGLATARNLTSYGINTDLAPVLDVGHGNFITPRSFGSTPTQVAVRGVAFANGLARGQVLATAKHFPGLGRAALNTDSSTQTVRATSAQLKVDLAPFQAAIRNRIPIVMVSTAVYPTLGSDLPAAWSRPIVEHLLRRQLGFAGVAITDALQTPAVNHYLTTPQAAVQAVRAGIDMVLAAGPTGNLSDTDGASIPTYTSLLKAVTTKALKLTTVQVAYNRVIALKQRL